MHNSILGNGLALLNNMVADKPGVIIGPIAQVFGYIIDFIFNIVHGWSIYNSLGFSIILLTIIVRCLMLPMGIKQQKSMIKMQKLAPELEKIKAKYGNSKDPEIMQKMNAEQQALYAKNKVNPLGGCLPLLITMPLFFGMSYIMNQSFMYIPKLNAVYEELSTAIMEVPDYQYYVTPLAIPHIPNKMINESTLSMGRVQDVSRVLNKFNAADWDRLLHVRPAEYPGSNSTYTFPALDTLPEHYEKIMPILERKQAIEIFFGLPLLEPCGWTFPGLIIPILVALTSFATSWIGSKVSTSTNPQMQTQQKIMMYGFPVMMVFMTVGMPAGVGLYWITSSVYQVAQQAVLNHRAGFPMFKKKEA
ncbi:MAG: YidC/Oxa1 family membrane protein insertase [Clostridiales bacterium]|nr:YidC/Oxa1 family membrane protein insertase [Clostridiales bacterium]